MSLLKGCKYRTHVSYQICDDLKEIINVISKYDTIISIIPPQLQTIENTEIPELIDHGKFYIKNYV